MTPEQRAEKIVGQHYVLNELVSRPTMVDLIAAQIREAVSDAVCTALEATAVVWKETCREAAEEAYKAALADYKADGLESALAQGHRDGLDECAKLHPKQRDEIYKYVAKVVRHECKEKSCENRCYHEHAVRSLIVEDSK